MYPMPWQLRASAGGPWSCKSAPNVHVLRGTTVARGALSSALVCSTLQWCMMPQGHDRRVCREEGEVSQRLAPAVTAAAEGLARLSAHLDAVAFREVCCWQLYSCMIPDCILHCMSTSCGCQGHICGKLQSNQIAAGRMPAVQLSWSCHATIDMSRMGLSGLRFCWKSRAGVARGGGGPQPHAVQRHRHRGSLLAAGGACCQCKCGQQAAHACISARQPRMAPTDLEMVWDQLSRQVSRPCCCCSSPWP